MNKLVVSATALAAALALAGCGGGNRDNAVPADNGLDQFGNVTDMGGGMTTDLPNESGDANMMDEGTLNADAGAAPPADMNKAE